MTMADEEEDKNYRWETGYEKTWQVLEYFVYFKILEKLYTLLYSTVGGNLFFMDHNILPLFSNHLLLKKNIKVI